MYINTPKPPTSKDDLYPTIYSPHLTNQFAPYFTSPRHSTLPYQYLPYLPRHRLYAKVSGMYPMFGYEPLEPLGLEEGEGGRERKEWMRERLLRKRDNHPPLPDAEIGKLVRGLAREVNFGVRKDALARTGMGKGGDGMLGVTIKEMNDLGDDVRVWSERNGLKNGGKGMGLGDGDKDPSTSNPPWLERTSRVRNSGHFARWGGRMSTTTVGGFAGGGVPRPERGDPFTSAVMRRPVRVSVPAGLMKAAANPDQIQEWYSKRRGTATDDGQDREWHHLRAKTPRTARMRPISYSRAHIARFHRPENNQGGATSQQSRRRGIPSLQSLGAPPIRPARRSSTNLDLVWSPAASSMWATTSSSDFSSTCDSEWSTSSDGSHSADEESLISAMGEAKPSSARTLSPGNANAMTATELRHPTSTPAPKTFPPWGSHIGDTSEDDERELPDNWPEPDHRYTHRGPGRGSSNRHLSAVNPLGFAGGGVPRRRASDVLPISLLSTPKVAVPDGLRQAAERSAKECFKATDKTSKESEAFQVSEEEKKARMFEETFRDRKSKMVDGVAVKEPDGEETKLLTIERASKDAMTRTSRMSRYEVTLSAALLLLAIMYAWEIHARYTP